MLGYVEFQAVVVYLLQFYTPYTPLFVLWAIGASNASLFAVGGLSSLQILTAPHPLHHLVLATTTIRERSMRKDNRRDMVVSKLFEVTQSVELFYIVDQEGGRPFYTLIEYSHHLIY